MEYYYTDNKGFPKGPVSIEALRSLAVSGALHSTCMVAPEGSQQWSPVGTLVPTVAPAPASPTEPLAIWSLVVSLVSLCCCGCLGWIPAIPGVICGHLALSKIGKMPQLQGKGLAIAGVIIGYFSFVSWLLYTVFFGGITILSSILEGMQ
jgi:hypothetical protein